MRGLRPIRLTDGLDSLMPSLLSAQLGHHHAATPDDFAGLGGAHGLDYSSRSEARQCHWLLRHGTAKSYNLSSRQSAEPLEFLP